MKRTVTLLKYEQRRALLGWDGGETSVIVFSEYLDSSEIRAMLKAYADPVYIKYATVVQVPIASHPHADEPSLIVDIEYETINLQKYAAMGDDGIAFTVWCGYAPRADKWFVRTP